MGLYNLTDEQKLVRQTARDFAENVVSKYVKEMEKTDRLPMELVHQAGELGLFGLVAPEEYGGSDLGLVAGCLVVEEIAKVSPAFAVNIYVHNFSLWQNRNWSEEVAEKYIKPAIKGEILLAYETCDPAGTQNEGEWPVFAKKDGDEWVLNGTRLFATGSASAGMHIVIGYDEEGQKHKFCVPAGTQGLEATYVEHMIGVHGDDNGTAAYNDVRIPLSYCCDQRASSGKNELFATPIFFGVTAISTGIAQIVLEKTRQYLLNRNYAGGVLYDNPAISQKLAEQGAKLLIARAGMFDLLSAVDAGEVSNPDIARAGLAGKGIISPLCLDIVLECMQLYGSLAVCEEGEIAHFVRDAIPPMMGDLPKSGHFNILANMNKAFPFC